MTPDPRDTDELRVDPTYPVIRCRRCDNPLPFGRIGRCADCIGRRGNPLGCVLVVVLAVIVAAVLLATPRSAPDTAQGTTGAPQSHPAPSAAAFVVPDHTGGAPQPRYRGLATWYCLSGSSACTTGYDQADMVAAIDSDLGFNRGDRIRVRYGDKEVVVTIADVCGCPGERLVDLTSGAFARLASLDVGVIPVTIELAGPTATLPATEALP